MRPQGGARGLTAFAAALAELLGGGGALAVTLSSGSRERPSTGAAEAIAVAGRLSGLLARAAGQREVGDPTRSLLSSFQICSAKCRKEEEFERFGEANDGGYLMCVANMPKGNVAYSLGVGNHDKWSYHVVKRLGSVVHQYDCFRVDGKAQIRKGGTFHPVCISGTGGLQRFHNAITFSQMLEQTGQSKAGRGTLLLKMDIEGSEWGVLTDVPPGMLQKFSQIVIEFHKLSDEAQHPLYQSAVRKLLNAGFKVAHLHGNNQGHCHLSSPGAAGKSTGSCEGGIYKLGSYRIPDVVEATFVLEDGPSDCQRHIQDFADEVKNSLVYEKLPSIELPAVA